ncbi:unnamed protein product, partial [marine sediment metagenome]
MEWYQFYYEWLKLAFSKPFLIADAAAGTLAIFGALLTKYVPKVESVMHDLTWLIPLGIFCVFVLASFIVAPYSIYKDKQDTINDLESKVAKLEEDLEKAKGERFADSQQLRNTYHEGQNIYVSDLVFARDSSTIDGDTFKNCHIYGPALVKLGGVGIISGCGFDGTLESSFVVTTNEIISGIVQF